VEGLRAFLALPVQKPVEERTGLTKKYDFVLKKGDNDAPATGQEGPPASDPDLVNLWNLGALGFPTGRRCFGCDVVIRCENKIRRQLSKVECFGKLLFV
jgi:hypothetical protein